MDKGVTDTNNMGAAMAPAAYDTLCTHFQDTGREPDFYDCIVTGDLGELGGELLCELFRRDGVDLSPSYTDCGRLIFDSRRQDVPLRGLRLRLFRRGVHRLSPSGAAGGADQAPAVLPHRGPPLPHHRLSEGEHPRHLHAVAVSARRDG